MEYVPCKFGVCNVLEKVVGSWKDADFCEKLSNRKIVGYCVVMQYNDMGSDGMWTQVIHPHVFSTKVEAEKFMAHVQRNKKRINLNNWSK